MSAYQKTTILHVAAYLAVTPLLCFEGRMVGLLVLKGGPLGCILFNLIPKGRATRLNHLVTHQVDLVIILARVMLLEWF